MSHDLKTSPPVPSEVTFRRAASSRMAGLLEYLLVLPIVASILCVAVGGITNALLEQMGAPATIRFAACTTGCLLTLVAVVRFAVRDYLRRAGSTVIISSASLRIDHLGRSTSVAFTDCREVRLVPCGGDAQCILYLTNGTTCRLPTDVAPFSIVHSALETTLVRQLAGRLGDEISSGHAIRVRDSQFRAWLRVLRGSLVILTVPVAMLTLRGIPVGLRLFRGGWLSVRQGWRGRKTDFQVTCDHLVPSGSVWPADVHPWPELREFRTDDTGLVLNFTDGRVVTMSLFAENYWTLVEWLRQGRHMSSRS